MTMRANELHVPTFPIRQFTWNEVTEELSAEASTLRFDGPGRLYNDACDVGIAVQGIRRTERFYLSRTEASEGDIKWWEFRPARKQCPVVAVVIFND